MNSTPTESNAQARRTICLAILGPTASGKTQFAIDLALQLHGEIICVDSTTVYRGFDIGSSKPLADDRAKVPHHLIDILDPNEPFSAYHFVELALETIQDVSSRGKLPIIVGGTYFYFRALQQGMYKLPMIPSQTIEEIEREFFEDEQLLTHKMHAELKLHDNDAAKNIHPNDRYRLLRALAIIRTTGELPSQLKVVHEAEAQSNLLWMKYAMTLSRHALNENIVRRTESMIKKGLIDETRALVENYPKARALQSIGYAEAVQFLKLKLTEKQLRSEIIEKTRQLAKRQMTWLRSDAEVRFIDARDLPRVLLEVENLQFVLKGNSCAQ